MMNNRAMAIFIYKKEKCSPLSASDYAVRYDDAGNVFAKMKGSKEFRTDLKENNTAWEICHTGVPIDKEEYDNF